MHVALIEQSYRRCSNGLLKQQSYLNNAQRSGDVVIGTGDMLSCAQTWTYYNVINTAIYKQTIEVLSDGAFYNLP